MNKTEILSLLLISFLIIGCSKTCLIKPNTNDNSNNVTETKKKKAPRLTESEVLKIAIEAIEKKWPGESKDNLPYVAEYCNDYSDGIWVVHGTLPKGDPEKGIFVLGGTAVVAIDDTNGEVFKIYHEQ